MPYKDLERKKEWERLHRPERLARSRELRRIEAAQRAARPNATGTEHNVAGFLIPLVAGGALAAYNPKLGMAAGGGTLAIAAIFKKGWSWWVLGLVILALALFFLLGQTKWGGVAVSERKIEKSGSSVIERPLHLFRLHQLAFDSGKRRSLGGE